MSDQNNRLQDSEQTLDAEAVKERIRRNKARILEAEDFTLSPEEIEKRKREATETEFQTE